MPLDPAKNFGKVTVSIGYNAAATSIALTAGHGARLPDPATDGAFNVTWWNATDYPDPSDDPNREIVRVTARSTDTLTVTRGQEGIAASTKNDAGKTYLMIITFTKKVYDDLVDTMQGSATFVVAASDAAATSKNRADYLCDGTDDDVVIQSAIDALPATGGRVVLTEGTFNLGNRIEIVEQNITLEGQGDSTQLVLGNAVDTDCILVADAESATVKNLLIDGNMANNDIGHGIQIFDLSTKVLIEGCTIRNTAMANIYDDGGTYTRILNNYLDTTEVGSNWANIEGVGNNGIVEGNTCLNGDYACIAVYNGEHIVVQNNWVTGSPRTMIADENGNNVIQNNVVIVASNLTEQAIIGYARDRVSGNSIYITNDVSAAQTGIYADNWGLQINENHIVFQHANFAHIGILAGNGDASIVSNFIINVDESPTANGSTGIGLDGDLNYAVSGNYINGFDIGIDAEAVEESTLTGNFFYNCIKAIDISGALGLAITGNSMELGNGDHFIVSTSDSYTRHVTITGNYFGGSGKDGIVLRSCKNCIVSGNTFRQVGATIYSGIILKTVSGTNYSQNNVVSNNTFEQVSGSPLYWIREDSPHDGPNIVIGNYASGALTEDISVQHPESDVSHNFTGTSKFVLPTVSDSITVTESVTVVVS